MAQHTITTNNYGLANVVSMLTSTEWYKNDAKHYVRSGHILDKIEDTFNWDEEPEEATDERRPGMVPSNKDAAVSFDVSEKQRETLKACFEWYLKQGKLPNDKTFRVLVRQLGVAEDEDEDD